jgi:chromosome segregation ATPase
MHVKDGGSVTALDLSRMVQAMEKMQNKLEWWNEQSREMYEALNKVETERDWLREVLRGVHQTASRVDGAAHTLLASCRIIAGSALEDRA